MFRRLRLLARSVRHTRPRQLVARTRLHVSRRTSRIAYQIIGPRPALAADAGRVAAEPPRRILPPRTQLVPRRGEDLVVSLVNRSWPLEMPTAWHPGDLSHLERLHLHYLEYLEGVDDEAFTAIVLDWIAQNPAYHAGYWIDSWNAYALSIRSVVLMQEYAERASRLSAPTRQAIERSVAAQIGFLERNLEVDIGGNHLLKNIKALLWAGCFFTGPRALSWRVLGEQLLERELDEQVLADGFHFELSPSYHIQAFVDLVECIPLVAATSLRSRLRDSVARMAQVVADMTHPDGQPSLFNDGGLHMTYSPADALRAFETQVGAAVKARGSFAFEDAGYFGIRSAGDLLIVDCGRVGPDHLPAHAHGDILSFEWTVDGQRVVVDPGVSEYVPGEWRRYSRSTAAHNTVTVADADQCEFWKSFRMGRRANVTRHRASTTSGLVVDGSHDGFAPLEGAPCHRRQLKGTGRRLEVRDIVSGGAGQPVAARLLFHPGLRVVRTDRGVEISNRKVRVLLSTEHEVTVDRAWWCPDFNVRLATTQVTLHYGAAPCEGRFHLAAQTDVAK